MEIHVKFIHLFALVFTLDSCAAGFKFIVVDIVRAVRHVTYVSVCHHGSIDITAASIIISGMEAGANPMFAGEA